MWVYLTREYLQAGSKPDIPPADIIANRARGNPELVGCVPLFCSLESAALGARAHADIIIIILNHLPCPSERPRDLHPVSYVAARQRQKKKFSPFCAAVGAACAESFWQSRLADRRLHLHLSRSLNGIVPKLPSQWCLLATDYIKCILYNDVDALHANLCLFKLASS